MSDNIINSPTYEVRAVYYIIRTLETEVFGKEIITSAYPHTLQVNPFSLS